MKRAHKAQSHMQPFRNDVIILHPTETKVKQYVDKKNQDKRVEIMVK